MKNVFQAFARYNGSVNQSIIELLKPLTREQITMKRRRITPPFLKR